MIKIVPIEKVIVSPTRQRKFFPDDALEELATSIEEVGLLQAPVVDEDLNLIAGERRLRAISSLSARNLSFNYGNITVTPGNIPVLQVPQDTAYVHARQEFDENIRRRDLTWQERARATQLLQQLLTTETTEPLKQDIAAQLFGTKEPTAQQVRNVTRDLTLARALDDPELTKLRSEKDALRALRIKVTHEQAKQLPHQTGSLYQLHNADFQQLLPTFEAEQFDCLCTDPIYGISAHTFGAQNSIHNYQDSYENWRRQMPILALQSYRTCRPQAHAFVFCALQNFYQLREIFEIAGWKVWPTPLIWVKTVGILPVPDYGPRRVYEIILFANKGKKPLITPFSDVFAVPSVASPRHPAEKPAELLRQLLSNVTVPGNHVLDPCCGSGSIFAAANQLHLRATGIELDSDSYHLSNATIIETERRTQND